MLDELLRLRSLTAGKRGGRKRAGPESLLPLFAETPGAER
jgi:hypothetical protein